MTFKINYAQYKDIITIEDFKAESEKITCLVGESGGGKTTLLKLLSKMISPTDGTVYIDNEPLEDKDTIEHRKRCMMMPQNPFIFNGTVKENIMLPLKYRDKTLDDSTLKSICERVHLKNDLDQNASNLSMGEKQRLALAQIIAADTPCILLDEPSSALDEETERDVIQKIVSFVKEQDKTLIMVTHSLNIAKQYADSIYTIEDGKIKGREHNGRH
ncbi:MAG: ABC transporter ATP-binding protein [Bacillota bacterium]